MIDKLQYIMIYYYITFVQLLKKFNYYSIIVLNLFNVLKL
jgi:hypothetical protein